MTSHERTPSPQPSTLVEPSTPLPLTPFQPTGPYPQVMLDLPTGSAVPLISNAPAQRIIIEGTLLDGAGKPIWDAMIETWQADAAGRYQHPADRRSASVDSSFWGYRRVATDNDGRFRIETFKPGPVPTEGAEHTRQAPHVVVAVYGGGILYRYVTRLYFDDEPANAADPVLQMVPDARRETLIARGDGTTYRFVIRLQGDGETVFFDV